MNLYDLHHRRRRNSEKPNRLPSAVAWSLCLALPFCAAAAVSAAAQPAFFCANHGPLPVDKITGYITQKIPDERIAKSIQACGVTFQLDATALDKLAAAHAGDAVLDALNQITAAKLTPEQAHAQVADLTAKAELAEKSGAAKKALPYRARIAFLEQTTNSDPGPLQYLHYDADLQRLAASLGGEEYWFDQVPSKSAQTLHDNWAKVRASQPYQDDADHARTLALDAISAPGIPRSIIEAALQKKIAAMNAEAQARLSGNDFAGAIAGYNAVLKLDPNNAEAKAGIAQAQAAQQAAKANQTQFLQGLLAAGIWLDPSSPTKLMWTIKDSEQTVNWQQASDYCQAQQLDGLANWRLPTIPELKSLYDPNILRQHHKKGIGVFFFRLKEPIEVRSSQLWSSEKKEGQAAMWIDDVTGQVEEADSNSKMLVRALCVRNFNPATDGLNPKP